MESRCEATETVSEREELFLEMIREAFDAGVAHGKCHVEVRQIEVGEFYRRPKGDLVYMRVHPNGCANRSGIYAVCPKGRLYQTPGNTPVVRARGDQFFSSAAK